MILKYKIVKRNTHNICFSLLNSLSSSGSLTFATQSSESDFLGFTFLPYRTVHHSLHWGPHWRNSQNISCFKESTCRRGEICSQNQFEAQNQTKADLSVSVLCLFCLLLFLSHTLLWVRVLVCSACRLTWTLWLFPQLLKMWVYRHVPTTAAILENQWWLLFIKIVFVHMFSTCVKLLSCLDTDNRLWIT